MISTSKASPLRHEKQIRNWWLALMVNGTSCPEAWHGSGRSFEEECQ